jgi:predicted PurR-regulated permease PerM
MAMDRVNWPRTRDILISIICIGIILGYAWNLLLGQFVHALALLLLSMGVAFLMTPAVNFLCTRDVPRILACFVVYVIVLAALGGLSYALITSLIRQVLTFQETVINFFNALPDQYTSFRNFLIHIGIPSTSIDEALNQIRGQSVSFAQTTANNILNIALIVTNTFIDILLITVLSFYFTLDGERVRDSIVHLAPDPWMPHVRLFEDALNRVVGNYIRGQLTLAVIIGMLAGIGCFFLGLPGYALIIGVLAFLFETIPMVGPALASIPAILLSLLLPGAFPRTLYIIIYFVIVQMLESNVLGPRIVGHAVGLHPIASILALIIGAQLFGAFGALLATPIVAAAWVVVASLYRSARGETADQMLAQKRTGWAIRPRDFLRKRKTPSVGTHDDELHVEELQETHSPKDTIASVKGPSITPMPAEHIELLRPIPDGKEPPSKVSEPKDTINTNKEFEP